MKAFFRTLALFAALLAFAVIVVGAYVRLSDAGLGCPDWPGCYGKAVPAQIADQHALAKAWKEMGHRYLAGGLGILIVLACFLSFRTRRYRGHAVAIVALVAFQATLGMWTVTLLLKPVIVTLHLLGGMATFALLLLLFLRLGDFGGNPNGAALRWPAAAALVALAAQIALGGWVSANYAALACPDLPGCRGEALPAMDFANAFHVFRELGRTGAGGLLPLEALVAIHWAHRMFAVLVVLIAGTAALRALRTEGFASMGAALGGLLLLQFCLGVANVHFGLPLPLAAAHNAGAALLLAALVVLNFFAFKGLSRSR
jgi:cytochrome c oxidase assembly protein subunit 15